jgi:hypothetical protein
LGSLFLQMDQDLIEDFELLQQDDDWVVLHKKIVDEREQKNLTITDFLVFCGLNPNRSYFKQLCCKTPKRLHPSKKRNSPGREFRDAVAKYFDERAVATLVVGNTSHQPLKTIISEWCLDNRPLLRERKISDIRLAEDSGSTGLIVYAYKECILSDIDIINMLMSDSNISCSLAGSDLRILSRYESQLLASLASPVCCNDKTNIYI